MEMTEKKMENKKMLGFLNSDNPFHRVIRRGLVMAGLTLVSVVIYDSLPLAPEWIIPALTGILAIVDKMLREMGNAPETQ